MELAHIIQITQTDMRWRTACHEAGHVVALYHQRRAWTRVHIIPRDGFLGMVEGVRTPHRGAGAELQDHVIFLLAGKAAVRLMVPHAYTGGWTDQVNAWRAAGWISRDPTERAALLAHARAAAEQLCARYRPAIHALAETLVRVKELDKQNARRIVAEAMKVAGRPPVRTAPWRPFTPVMEGADTVDR